MGDAVEAELVLTQRDPQGVDVLGDADLVDVVDQRSGVPQTTGVVNRPGFGRDSLLGLGGLGYAERAGHRCILGSCVGSAYMGGQLPSMASGRSS